VTTLADLIRWETIAGIATIAIANPGGAKTAKSLEPSCGAGSSGFIENGPVGVAIAIPAIPASQQTDLPEPKEALSRVRAMLRGGVRYAILVEDANTDPVVMHVGTDGGVREVLIPRDQYDPFEVLAKVHAWDARGEP
jgi:hypothetical protein